MPVRGTSAPTLTSSSRRRWEWDKRVESGERAARENGDPTGHQLRPALFRPGVRGAAGGAGYSVALGLTVQFGNPGPHRVALDDRMHRGLLGGVWGACVPRMRRRAEGADLPIVPCCGWRVFRF